MIECNQVRKSYDWLLALDDTTLHVNKGECVALVGPSGNGKTTLLRSIAGLQRIDSGTISIDGQLVSNHVVHVEPGKRGVGMMFQNLALWPHLRAEGQLRLVLHAWPKAERWKRVEEMLAMVKLSDKGKRFPHELSGGEQQRLALARALAPAPKVLLLDEPLSNLDPELRLEIRMELKRIIRSTGTTTLMVTHLPEDAEAMAARIARMEKGRIV